MGLHKGPSSGTTHVNLKLEGALGSWKEPELSFQKMRHYRPLAVVMRCGTSSGSHKKLALQSNPLGPGNTQQPGKSKPVTDFAGLR